MQTSNREKSAEILKQLLQGNLVPEGEVREQLLTLLKLAEPPDKEIQANAPFFFDFAESYPLGLILVDYSGTLVYWNPAAEEITGFTSEEMTGQNFKDAYALFAESAAKFTRKTAEYEKLFDILSGTGPVSSAPIILTDRIKRKDGRSLHIELCVFPLSHNGREYLCATARDITVDASLASKIKLLSLAVEQSPSPILIADSKGVIEYVNRAFVLQFGYMPEDVIGRNPSVLKSDKTPPSVHETMWKTLLSGERWQGEILDKRKDGTYIWLLTSISPVKNAFGETECYISLYEDITGIKEMQQKLHRALEFSEEANSLKTSILNNISHELRTPMNGILGYAQIITEEIEDAGLKTYAEKIIRSGNRLLNTLNSLINLSELEANKMAMEPDPVHIPHLVKAAVMSVERIVRDKGLSIETIFTDDKIYCTVDLRFIRKIVNELLDNAIKFTEAGSISVNIYKEKRHPGNSETAVIAIKDTGLGVPPEMQEMIFREFRQVSEGYSRRFEGTGLGLTIARKFARLMGGDITLESTQGGGSTFYLSLPVSAEQDLKKEYSAKEHSETLKPRTLLLLTDDDNDLRQVEYILHGLYRVFPAHTPEEALIAAMNNRFDVIMIDSNFDKGADDEHIRAILGSLPGYGSVPCIAVTRVVNEFETELFKSEGYAATLQKPIQRNQLLELFSRPPFAR